MTPGPRFLPARARASCLAALALIASSKTQAAMAQTLQVHAVQAETILLDGRCDEPAWARARPTGLAEQLSMIALDHGDGVTICWRLPSQTLGLDLYIEDAQGALHDLHISAQTGERTRTAGGWPEWSAFGQHHGWYAPPYAFSGFKADEAGTQRVVFASQPYRELQFTRARFGPGPWRIMVEAQSMIPGAAIVRYPANGSPDDPSTWGRLDAGFSRRP